MADSEDHSMSFFQRWFSSIWLVLIKPTPETFDEITSDVEDVLGESFLWISIITTLYFIVVVSLDYYQNTFFLNLIGSILFLTLYILLFTYFLNYLKEKIFHNEYNCHERLFFSIVVIIIISVLIDLLLLTLLPNVVFLSYAAILYSVVLSIICVKSITKLNYWQSLINLILSAILASISVVFVGFFFARLIQIIPFWFSYY